jgi:hypothetical protein
MIGVRDTGFNVRRGNVGEIIIGNDFFNGTAGGKKIEYLPDHNPGAFYARLAVTDPGINGDSLKHC